MDIVTLETPRLLLRAFRDPDLDSYAELCADEEVMRYIGQGRLLSREEAWRHMAMMAGHWHLKGYGVWAVEEKQSGTLIGRIGFWNPEGWPGLELGWLLARHYWGRGLAVEGARAALNYAFENLNHEHIISVIHPGNTRSIRVAEKLGETFEARRSINGIDVLIYGISPSVSPIPQSSFERG